MTGSNDTDDNMLVEDSEKSEDEILDINENSALVATVLGDDPKTITANDEDVGATPASSGLAESALPQGISNGEVHNSTDRPAVGTAVVPATPSPELDNGEPPEEPQSSSHGPNISVLQNVEVHPGEERPDLLSIRRSHLLRCRDVFIPTKDFIMYEKTFGAPNGRAFVVYGPNHSGKFTSAINISIKARPEALMDATNVNGDTRKTQPEIVRYRRQTFDTISLENAIRKTPQKSVVIIRDAFEKNIHPETFTGAELEHLQSVLEEREIDLILTTEMDASALHDIDTVKISAKVDDLEDVFKHHLLRLKTKESFSTEWIGILEQSWSWIGQDLIFPSHIPRFLDRAAESSEPLTEKVLRNVARSVGHFGQMSAKAWFSNLSKNARLFALLVGLFEDIDLELLTEIYVLAVRFFRGDGIEDLDDARSGGIRDLLEEVRAFEDDGEIHFEDSLIRREAGRQIENHSHLLWSLGDIFLDLIRTYENRQFGRLRMFIGSALGRLGIHRLGRLSDVLETLADSEPAGVAATAGYALDHVCRQEDSEYRRWSLSLLDTWILSGQPRRMWAAGSAIWRIYRGHFALPDSRRTEDHDFLRSLRHRLRVLVQRANTFHPLVRRKAWREAQSATDPRRTFAIRLDQWTANNVSSCLFAIHRIMESDPIGACIMLGSWIEAPQTDAIHQVGKLSVAFWLDAAGSAELRPNPSLRRALLNLAPSVLRIDDGPLLEQMLKTFETWIARELGVDEVARGLLELVHGTDIDNLRRLRVALLTTFIEPDIGEVTRLGRSLLRRIQFLLGIPPHPSENARGTLLYDTSRVGLERELSLRLAIWTEALLDGCLKTSMRALGRTEPETQLEEKQTGLPGLRPKSPRARLAAPILETGLLEDTEPGAATSVVLTFTSKPVRKADRVETIAIVEGAIDEAGNVVPKLSSTASVIVLPRLIDLAGIGRAREKLLKDAGINRVRDLAETSPEELARILSLSTAAGNRIIEEAKAAVVP